MNVLASIEHFAQLHFGDSFSSIEAFYLKNILILIQGILELGHHSISSRELLVSSLLEFLSR